MGTAGRLQPWPALAATRQNNDARDPWGRSMAVRGGSIRPDLKEAKVLLDALSGETAVTRSHTAVARFSAG